MYANSAILNKCIDLLDNLLMIYSGITDTGKQKSRQNVALSFQIYLS